MERPITALLCCGSVRRHELPGMHMPTLTTGPATGDEAVGSARIVLTAPLTEMIDHAGYFIQMSMASLPIWLEGILDKKYPTWRELEYNADGTARYMPAGLRVLEASLLRRFSASDIVCCYPADVHRFIGPETRVVAVSTHNPLGVTFAAGVYTSIFGSSKQPINSHYARELFAQFKASPHRDHFKVIVGGSGGWQIVQTDTWEELGVDCVVEGRSESDRDARRCSTRRCAASRCRAQVDVAHPTTRDAILFPDKRTTFGVVEMTTGCGRRCQFCVPDLNPQIDLPKDKIMGAVRANVRDGNKQISLATEDMFIWGQVHTDTPFYFPNREALLDLYSRRREHARRRAARAQPRDDRAGGGRSRADRTAVGACCSTRARSTCRSSARIRRAQGARAADRARDRLGARWRSRSCRARRAVPDRRVAERRRARARGSQPEQLVPRDDADRRQPGRDRRRLSTATLDLIYEVERRGLFAFFIPSIFTPLHDTRMETKKGVTETRQLTPLQWQLMMKCWKMNLRPGPDELVGTDGVARRRARPVGLEAAQAERARTSPGRC